MTDKEKLRILVDRMKGVAVKTGPLHGWWELIFDMEVCLEGREVAVPTSNRGIQIGEG